MEWALQACKIKGYKQPNRKRRTVASLLPIHGGLLTGAARFIRFCYSSSVAWNPPWPLYPGSVDCRMWMSNSTCGRQLQGGWNWRSAGPGISQRTTMTRGHIFCRSICFGSFLSLFLLISLLVSLCWCGSNKHIAVWCSSYCDCFFNSSTVPTLIAVWVFSLGRE